MRKNTICFGLLLQVVVLMVVSCGTPKGPVSLPPIEETKEERIGNVQDGTVSLEQAIQAAGERINNSIEAGRTIAVLNLTSSYNRFSKYVLDELLDKLVNETELTVVERENLDKIRDEQGLQISGEVSDESATSIGKILGAQFIVTGSLTKVGNNFYHFMIRVLDVETAAVKASLTRNLRAWERRIVGLTEEEYQNGNGKRPPIYEYEIGDTGPAGGIIFHIKRSFSDNWRYLEAAPAEAEFTARWSVYDQTVSGTKKAKGDGKENTRIIERRLSELKESGCAAQICFSMDINGYKDWFLPSRAELDLMYINLKDRDLGDFGNEHYWSSSQDSTSNSWSQNFRNGDQSKSAKNNTYSVRAVRAF